MRSTSSSLISLVDAPREKGIELVKVGEIIARVPHRSSFPDIGAGGGALTIPISQSFGETTVVESNEKQAAFLRMEENTNARLAPAPTPTLAVP